ncbi:MAG: 6-phosphogluconolactonase [Bacteroidetes bacterium]|nr:6-phosphogluconolactonase [Bacteroidota bacterium]MCL5026490.1 6-phosphogluconolactonase [Chloroflexota bacterium]
MADVYPDLEALSDAAARLFVERAGRASSEDRPFRVAISGGNTPRRTYELLAQPPFRDQVVWERVEVFWGDERCVQTDDPRSNQRMAREALLDRVPIPKEHIHPVLCDEAPGRAAARYEALLRALFGGRPPRFDLVFLGLGENGHTASLFPGTPALDERKHWCAEVYVPGEGLHRVTLTAPVINRAAVIAFLVSGAAKARVLQEVLEGPTDPHRLPAQLIHPTNGELRWLVDREAATYLKQGSPTR